MTDQSSVGQVSTGGGQNRGQVFSDDTFESSVTPEPHRRPANLPASTTLVHTAPKPPRQLGPACQVLKRAQLLTPPCELGNMHPSGEESEVEEQNYHEKS